MLCILFGSACVIISIFIGRKDLSLYNTYKSEGGEISRFSVITVILFVVGAITLLAGMLI
jgi:hypothetical protein